MRADSRMQVLFCCTLINQKIIWLIGHMFVFLLILVHLFRVPIFHLLFVSLVWSILISSSFWRFESVYMDNNIRVVKDIRGDYLVVERAPYSWKEWRLRSIFPFSILLSVSIWKLYQQKHMVILQPGNGQSIYKGEEMSWICFKQILWQ